MPSMVRAAKAAFLAAAVFAEVSVFVHLDNAVSHHFGIGIDGMLGVNKWLQLG